MQTRVCAPAPPQNELEAEISGTVVKILVENGDAVLPGQVRRRCRLGRARACRAWAAPGQR